MKITNEELRVLEELHHYGTPLDGTVLEEAKAACRGLEIFQTGNCTENVVFAQASGGVGIILSVDIENTSDRILRLEAVRLEMPWSAADFHWLRRPSSTEVRDWGGYVLAASGPCGFDPSVVLNHHFGRDSKFYPGDRIEGLLMGEGTALVPANYPDRTLVPMRLIVFTSRGERFGSWVSLSVRRKELGSVQGAAGKQAHPKTTQNEKVRA
jgi:hypothetical protein